MKGGFGLYEEILNELDKVLKQNKEKKQVAWNILNAKYRTVGRTQFPISPSDRQQTIQKAAKHYNNRITKVYDSMNKQLEEKGKPILNNPFMKGDL